MTCALCSVADEQYLFGQKFFYLFQRGDCARDVGSGSDDCHFRFRLYQGSEGFGTNVSVRQRTDVVSDDPGFFEIFERTENGIVFHARGDDMIARRKRAENSDVQRFRAIFCEDYPLEPPAIKILVEGVAAVLYHRRAGKGELVSAPARIRAQLYGGGCRGTVPESGSDLHGESGVL